jgi:hypothetical protein
MAWPGGTLQGMKRCLAMLAGVLVAGVLGAAPERMGRVSADGALGIGKVTEYRHDRDAEQGKDVLDKSLDFERQYRDYGAVTREQRRGREGMYFDVRWDSKRAADVTVRMEYRQKNTKEKVYVLEARHDGAAGGQHSAFEVTGDAYRVNGVVTAWRVQLVRDGQVQAERRSFLW